MQAIKVNGTSHMRTNYGSKYGFAEKCTEDKWHFPARCMPPQARQPILQMMQDMMQDATAAFAKGSKGKVAENLPKQHSLKKKKKIRKKEKHDTNVREDGQELEVMTKRGAQCLESSPEHPIWARMGTSSAPQATAQHPEGDATLRPAKSCSVATTSPQVPGTAEAKEGCCEPNRPGERYGWQVHFFSLFSPSS